MSVVGLDLGTTNTVVACLRSGKVHVLADEHGARLLPSVVSFHPNGDVLVGGAAKSRRFIDPQNTVYSHKRLIGRSWGSPEIAQAKSRFAFELKEGPGQGPLIRARGQDYTLPEISAFVLKRTRQVAETALGRAVERAVITVPAHFNELQRASTKVAGRVSGLEVLRILNEPTAAALAYGLGRAGNERVAVYDFGGGTFDCTLLDLNGNVFEVLATAGDSFLGGDDVDTLIAERMAESYLRAHRSDPRTDLQMLERLKTTAEEMKMALSTAETQTVVLKDFGHGHRGSSINFTFTMTRLDLEHMITPLVERSFKVTQDALALSRLSPNSFDKVILVGGSTRIPLVRRRVEAFFGAPPLDRVNPDEVVAIGAAIQAAALTEGVRRRSIPAAPPVMGTSGPPSGVQSDAVDNTQTASFDPSEMGRPTPTSPSQPPKGGFHPASTAPPATRTGPATLAPFTQPMGGRSLSAPAPPMARPGAQADADDPSMASFPDLSAPTPFDGFPTSSGPPPSGAAVPPHRPPASERSFGGWPVISSGGPEQHVEPLSLPSTTRASAPSFPTSSGAADRGAPPSRTSAPMLPDDGPFGALRDLSLISTSGMSAPPTAVDPTSALDFGHVSDDLSLVSTPSATANVNAHADADADLAALAEPSDLPSLAGDRGRGRRPDPRKPGQLGMTAGGGAAMVGKPPPNVAPQPFGPMGKIGEAPAALPQTAALQARPQPNAPPATRQGPGASGLQGSPARPGTQPPRTGAMPAHTATMPAHTDARGEPPARSEPPPAAASSPGGARPSVAPPSPVAPFGPPPVAPLQPPPAQQFQQPPHRGFGSVPPPGPAFPPVPSLRASQPPLGGPRAYPSQPPEFGAYLSMPPDPPLDVNEMGRAMGSPGHAIDNTARLTGAPPHPGAFGTSGAVQRIGYTSPVLVDVTPRGLVVETAGGYTDTIIPRNSKIPCERTRRFATGRDVQTTVRVRVGQGEDPFFHQITFLGEVELSGLRPAPRGEVVVAVTFEVDADGTLRIRARDVQSGQEARAALQLIGVADESSVVMMINRFAQQPVVGTETPRGPNH